MIMGIISRLFTSDVDGDEKPCRVTGHDWRETGVSGYYTHGVPHFGPGDSWRVEKKLRIECRKCGDVKFKNERVGRIKVDKETDELSVVQSGTLRSTFERFV